MEKIDPSDKQYASYVQKFVYHETFRKAILQTYPDGSRVKLYTKVLNLHPQNSEREKYQKILVSDLRNKPISLWLRKDDFHQFENLEPNEYFVLNATVKTVEQNNNARFLAFDTLTRGDASQKDPIIAKYFEEKIKYHSQKLLEYLDLWRAKTPKTTESMDFLAIILRSFHSCVYPELKLQKNSKSKPSIE